MTASLLNSPGHFSAIWPSNVIVWMMSARPLISNSSNPLKNPLGIVPGAPITIDITVTFTFLNFVQFPCKFYVLFSLFIFFGFYTVIHRDISFFCKLFLGLVIWQGLYVVFVSENSRELCASNSQGRILVIINIIISSSSISCTCFSFSIISATFICAWISWLSYTKWFQITASR